MFTQEGLLIFLPILAIIILPYTLRCLYDCYKISNRERELQALLDMDPKLFTRMIIDEFYDDKSRRNRADVFLRMEHGLSKLKKAYVCGEGLNEHIRYIVQAGIDWSEDIDMTREKMVHLVGQLPSVETSTVILLMSRILESAKSALPETDREKRIAWRKDITVIGLRYACDNRIHKPLERLGGRWTWPGTPPVYRIYANDPRI